MEPLIWTLTLRSLLALALAALGAASARWSTRPGMTYLVCALAIAVLLAPPLVDVALLPAPAAASASVVADPTLFSSGLATFPAARPSSAAFNPSIGRWLLTLWAVGSFGILSIGLWRLRRFKIALGDRRPAPPEVQGASDRLAREIGLRRPPRVRLTECAVTPLLLPRARTLEIVFPSELLRRLTSNERDALLTHELSHLRRRDHWMRLFEFAGTTLFWWHPAVWWARNRLRRAEEQLCDRRVLDHLPHLRAAYARGLFKTAEFLAGAGRRLPALASGAGEARFLKERLMMIVGRRKARTLSTGQRLLLGLLASGLLIFLPTRAERAPEEPQPPVVEAAETGQRMLEIERQARELEMELARLRAEQQALQGGEQRPTADREAERMYHEARRMAQERQALAELLADKARRSQTDREGARELAERMEFERQIELEERRSRIDRELALQEIEIDRHRREAELRERDLSQARETEASARLQALERVERAQQEFELALAERLEALTDGAEPGEPRSTSAEIRHLKQLLQELETKLVQEESGAR